MKLNSRAANLIDRPRSPAGAIMRLAPNAETSATSQSRTVRFILSTGEVDRYGDRIDPAGWRLANYRKNPVVLFAHDSSALPIGRCSFVGLVDGRLVGDIEFMSGEMNPLADAIFEMVRGRFLNACSIGFAPLEFTRSTDPKRPGGIDFSSVELLEISIVPIPALPSALVAARAAGIATRAFDDWAARELTRKENPLIPRHSLNAIRRDFAAAPLSRSTAPAAPAQARSAEGFASLGDFLRTLVENAGRGADCDKRLVRAPTGAGEVDPSGGGFLVPSAYATELIGSIYENAIVAPLCDRRETDRPAKAVLPAIAETSRHERRALGRRAGLLVERRRRANRQPAAISRAGIFRAQVGRVGHGHARTAARCSTFGKPPSTRVRVGSGLPARPRNHARDGRRPAARHRRRAGHDHRPEISRAGLCDRHRREHCKYVVAPAGALPAPRGLARQRGRRAAARSRKRSDAARLGRALSAAGRRRQRVSASKGRPVLVVEQLPTLGTPGDFILADLNQYVLLDGGLKSALSLDVLFQSDQVVFKFVWRGDGKPAWPSAITPFNGGATRSPFVMLAQR